MAKSEGTSLKSVHYGHPHLNMEALRAIGTIGAWSILFVLFLPILHFTGIETFALPETRELWINLIIVGIMDMTFNVCIVVAIGLSSPLLVNMLTLLALPISMIVDMVQGIKPHLFSFLGAALIVSGVLILLLGAKCRSKLRKEPKHTNKEDFSLNNNIKLVTMNSRQTIKPSIKHPNSINSSSSDASGGGICKNFYSNETSDDNELLGNRLDDVCIVDEDVLMQDNNIIQMMPFSQEVKVELETIIKRSYNNII